MASSRADGSGTAEVTGCSTMLVTPPDVRRQLIVSGVLASVDATAPMVLNAVQGP